MKYALLIIFTLFAFTLQAQIENVVVETYYVSDSLDATDTTAGRVLDAGSKTYRIYIDLAQGSKLKKIFADTSHQLSIICTDNIYNNIDRPSAYFGYLINKAWFNSNPTLALDSWLTLGRGAKNYTGVFKENDTDGSFIGGANNNGGSSGVAGGILVNNNAAAGIPLLNADGLMPDTATLSQWLDDGFKDTNGDDSTVLGSFNQGNKFISNNCFLQQNSGVVGDAADNKVLVAQITTRGEIAFALNVVVEEPGNPLPVEVTYVAALAQGEVSSSTLQVSPWLTYPTACGCRDPHYIEYNAAYACDNADSCKHPVVFGCMDTLACNYDPLANYNITSLCCYPGSCSDRNLETICPVLNNERKRVDNSTLYPNPANNFIVWNIPAGVESETAYTIFNTLGVAVLHGNNGKNAAAIESKINIAALTAGLYSIKLSAGDAYTVKKIIIQ